MATIIDTPNGIAVFQALAVKGGLKAIKLGLRVNTAYTPKNCMAMATKITGKQFKARDYDGAIKALEEWISEQRID